MNKTIKKEVQEMSLEEAQNAFIEVSMKLKNLEEAQKEDVAIKELSDELKAAKSVFTEKKKDYKEYIKHIMNKIEASKL